LLKIVRNLQGFDALYVMSTAISGSASACMWAVVLLCAIQMSLALIMTQVLMGTYFKDETVPVADRQKVYEYFGTFSRALLSMFEMTLANWPPICRLMTEKVNEWFMLFFIVHKLTLGFAVVSVINGVFMQETFEVAKSDDGIMFRQKELAAKTHARKMKALFRHMDASQDHQVDREEFHNVLQDSKVQLWLASMDIKVEDPDLFFDLVACKDGYIDEDSFAKGTGRLKGGVTAWHGQKMLKDLESHSKVLESVKIHLETIASQLVSVQPEMQSTEGF